MSKMKYNFLILLALLLTNCAAPKTSPSPHSGKLSPEPLIARGKEFMVVSENKLASELGFEILAKGGNAFDAAVAVSFALTTLRPHSTGIGGGGFFLLYDSETSKTSFLDARERAPSALKSLPLSKRAKEKNPGAFVGVPGLVKGLHEVYKNFGSGIISWQDLVKPSVALAREGFIIDPLLEGAIKVAAKNGALDYSGTARKILGRGYGVLARRGQKFKNPELAKLLEAISLKGPDAFYKGALPRQLSLAAKKYGGTLSAKDFNNYKTIYREPRQINFENYQILTSSLPSSGGLVMAQLFGFLELLADQNPNPHTLAELQSLAFEDRAQYLGDPAYSKINAEKLIDSSYLASRLRSFSKRRIREIKNTHNKSPIPTSTTHISITDAQGNVVSSTQSINHYFGSGLYAGGVFLNNTLDDFSYPKDPNAFGLLGEEPNYPEAGKTPLSSMTPTIVFRNNKPFLALGSPGGPKIISAIFQTIVNRTLRKLSLYDSIAAPRLHHQWQPSSLYLEKDGFSESETRKLKKLGHNIEETKYLVGNVSALEIGSAGNLIGVADPRRSGVALGK